MVLVPQWQVPRDTNAFCEDGDKKARSRREEHELSPDPLRREGRMFRLHLWSYLPDFCCTGPMGAIGARPSLRPLTIIEGELIASLGRNAPRERERVRSAA
ncbi:hypothetical protein BE61_04770 [Bradyrhizobium elkanii USDA 61]|nr:hypothetical protein BE61_04770 [Bradyrhizobium elkanii USDA 61]